jgi:mannose-6-phosphate isomerase
MAVTRLIERRVAKPWGRRDLPEPFGAVQADEEPVGEIWFEDPAARDLPLLVKYLFTSEKLSVQVHPGDSAARKAGYERGKEEAWLVLRAEPGATIGLGLKREAGKDALRAAAADGSIEHMLDWRPVAAGDFLYSPAGTVHAIGPGLALIEIQQNVDLTYRLYDYERPRELHVEEAIEAADPRPYEPSRLYRVDEGREILRAEAFTIERMRGERNGALTAGEAPVWLVPVRGTTIVGGRALEPGTVWLADSPSSLSLGAGAELLVAYSGPAGPATISRP